MSRGVTVATLTLLCALAAGCSRPPPTEWLEDVQLGDGSVIRVERAHEWMSTRALGQGKRYATRETRLRIVEGKPMVREWNGFAEAPLVLDLDSVTNELVLLAIPRSCPRYFELGKPQPPYVAYRYRGNAWVKSALSANLVGRKPNLLVYPKWEAESPFISLAAKAERNRRLSYPEIEIRTAGPLPGC